MKPLVDRPRLSKDTVVQAAITLAGQTSIDALSMRKLAEALGVEAMSLYNHVKNKEDLLDSMLDVVVQAMYIPDLNGNWRQEIHQATLSSHQVLVANPWASVLMVSRPSVGLAKLAHFNAIQGCFCQAGLSPQMADKVRIVIDGYLYGSTQQHILYARTEQDRPQLAAQFLPHVPVDLYPHSYALVKIVADGLYDGKHDFEFGLNLLLDGIQHIIQQHSLQ